MGGGAAFRKLKALPESLTYFLDFSPTLPRPHEAPHNNETLHDSKPEVGVPLGKGWDANDAREEPLGHSVKGKCFQLTLAKK